MEPSRKVKIAKGIFDPIKAVTAAGPPETLFEQVLETLRKMAAEQKIPIAIVGGLAAIHHGYRVTTEDIDICIHKKDDQKFIQKAPSYGFKVEWESKLGWHTLTYKGLEINVVPEGGQPTKTAPTTIPGPKKLGVKQGLGYANLSGWMEMKLATNRPKDQAHIIGVLQNKSPKEIVQIRNSLTKIHKSYLSLFEDLLKRAEEEKTQKPR